MTTVRESASTSSLVGMSSGETSERCGAGLVRLAGCIIALLLVWGVLLPWMARQPGQAAKIEWLEERGIDPSAMYYTELEAMQPILQKLNVRERRLPPGARESGIGDSTAGQPD